MNDMNSDKLKRISEVVLSILKLNLQIGALNKASLIKVLEDRKNLTYEERQQVEELFLSEALTLCSSWLAENFPSLSPVEECRCSDKDCTGFRLKVSVEEKSFDRLELINSNR